MSKADLFGEWFQAAAERADENAKDDGVRFAALDNQITIKKPNGNMVVYGLDMLRFLIESGDEAGVDVSLEKRALAAYDEYQAEQRRLLEERLNKRAKRVKILARRRCGKMRPQSGSA